MKILCTLLKPQQLGIENLAEKTAAHIAVEAGHAGCIEVLARAAIAVSRATLELTDIYLCNLKGTMWPGGGSHGREAGTQQWYRPSMLNIPRGVRGW